MLAENKFYAEKNYTSFESIGKNDAADAMRAAIAAAVPHLGVAPDGVWLWCRLMDWCRKQRIAPATQDDLFAIVAECHAANRLRTQENAE